MGDHLVEPLVVEGYELIEGQDVGLLTLTEEDPYQSVIYTYREVI